MRRPAALLALAAIGCGGSGPAPAAASAPAEEPPVALNADPTVQYPPDLYDRRVEGDVVLRLFVDSTGHLVPESTRVSESSGFAALDSAAVRGTPRLRYAPARRHGLPVATAFLQTIEFRHPEGALGAPAEDVRTPPAAVDTPRVRRDSARVTPRPPPDTTRARRDTAPPKPDSVPPPDSTKSRPDSNAPTR